MKVQMVCILLTTLVIEVEQLVVCARKNQLTFDL